MALHGATFSRICTGPAHCDSKVDWAANCHDRSADAGDSHGRNLGHEDFPCIDIFVTSAVGPGSGFTGDPANQPGAQKPVLIKSDTSGHPFCPSFFTEQKSGLFSASDDAISLSIATTILIV